MAKKKFKKHKQVIRHRKNWTQFPSFTYPQKESEIAYVPEGFIRLIKEAVRNLDYYDENIFSDEDRDFYRLAKKLSFAGACHEIFGAHADCFDEMLQRTIQIGQYIYDYIKAAGKFNSYIPFSDVSVFLKGSNFTISFDALLSRSSPGGRIYYTKTPPKVAVENKEFKVGFSRHAIERVFDRAMISMDYFDVKNAYSCLSDEVDCEACFLPNEKSQRAISLFEYCAPGYFSGLLAGSVLNIKDIKEDEYKYRFGYCPVSFFEGFVKAITLLSPGMSGTPEYELLKNAGLPAEKRQELENSIANSTKYIDLTETNDFKAIKWFHYNGISQVLPSNLKQ